MTVTMFKGKLHRLTVTEADLHYEGSITLDQELMDLAGLVPYERVQVLNVNAGTRTVCLNGPAARLVAPGDQVIVIAYAQMTPEEAKSHKPRVVLVDEANNPKGTFDLEGVPVTDPHLPAVTNATALDPADETPAVAAHR